MAEIKKINGNTLCDDVARATAEEAKAAADEAKGLAETAGEGATEAKAAAETAQTTADNALDKVFGVAKMAEYDASKKQLLCKRYSATGGSTKEPIVGTNINLLTTITVGVKSYAVQNSDSYNVVATYVDEDGMHVLSGAFTSPFGAEVTLTETVVPYTEQVQADWGENSTSSAAYIKNRPFYEEETYTSVAFSFPSPSTLVETGVYRGEEKSAPAGYNSDTFRIKKGEKYLSMVAGGGTYTQGGIWYLYGNGKLAKTLNSTFANYETDDSVAVVFYNSNTPTTYVFSTVQGGGVSGAYTAETKVTKLDKKYLPYTAGENVQISDTGAISATDTAYTAGDGIAIEDGVISCTVEGGANSFTETGEMVTVYPAAHSSVGVVSTISGQNSAWDRANEIVLRQVPEGGNLLDDAFTFGEAGKVITKDGLTATINADRTVTVTGTNTAGTWSNVVSATYFSQTASYEIRPFPAGTYTLPNKLSATIRYMGGSGGTSEESGKHETFTTTAPWYIKQLYISYSADAAANETVPIALFYGQKAPTLSDYAYKGATYKKQFSAAVTDGTFDWTTGELRNTSGDLVETLEATSIKALDGANTFFVGISKNTVTGTLTSGGGTGTVVDCTDYSLPVLAFEGDISAMTKANPVTLNYTFGEHSGTLTCKWQGNSSLAYDKKNYTIKFDTAFEVNDGWGEHQKYVLKANYMDFSHCRNVVSAKLWGQIVAARATENTALKACPNYGVIDGFPITLTINGEYYGVYTMNIPKDPWMMNMGSGTNECILCAGNACPSNFFKAAATLVDDDDLEIEYITDESNTAWAVTSVNNLINACINSDGSDLDTTIATMLDWDSAIDYYIFVALLRGDDMVGKNYLLNTYDGTKWFFGAYDMDSVFGLHWSGQSFLPATTGTTFAASMAKIAENHRLFELIKTYKKDALKARYKELRTGVMSEDNVGMMFRNFAGQIPAPLLDEDNKKWTKIPNTNGNNVQQILDWYRLRVATIDAEIDKM